MLFNPNQINQWNDLLLKVQKFIPEWKRADFDDLLFNDVVVRAFRQPW